MIVRNVFVLLAKKNVFLNKNYSTVTKNIQPLQQLQNRFYSATIPNKLEVKAVYGGTFDPPHAGHLTVAKNLQKQLNLKVIFVPTLNPANKIPIATHAQRAKMMELATIGEKGFLVDPTPYTSHYETAVALRKKYPEDSLCFILGMDKLQGSPLWLKDLNKFLDIVNLVIVSRPGYQLPETDFVVHNLLKNHLSKDSSIIKQIPSGKILICEGSQLNYSSTAIRKAFNAKLPLEDGQVAKEVLEYIKETNLYNPVNSLKNQKGLLFSSNTYLNPYAKEKLETNKVVDNKSREPDSPRLN